MPSEQATGNASKETKGSLKTIKTSENVERVRVSIQTGSSSIPTVRADESGENKDHGGICGGHSSKPSASSTIRQ
ncbi:hypothetical protein TNCV_512411 [Trichonephila clavipes]|nr:hypothetical protein TNCV_512411 [Trichonephila clavipes]